MNFNQIIDSIGTFESGMDIVIFGSKPDNFFLANSIEINIQKRVIMRSSSSEGIHEVFFSLCANLITDVPYETLMSCLNKYFESVTSYFVARHIFYRARRRVWTNQWINWGAHIENFACDRNCQQ